MAKVEWWGKAMPKHFRVFWLIVELVFSVAIVEAQARFQSHWHTRASGGATVF